MLLSLRTRQVLGVTLMVGVALATLSAVYVGWIVRVGLEESESRGELLARTVFQQAAAAAQGDDPLAALASDASVRSLLQAGMAYSQNVTYIVIVDSEGRARAHSSPVLDGERLPPQATMAELLARNPIAQLRAVWSDATFEVREPLLLGRRESGAIRVGLSMLLVRSELKRVLRTALFISAVALVVASVGAMLFAGWVLRPIHVLRSGLDRLERGETGVKLELPAGEEFVALERSFANVSAELASVRARASESEVAALAETTLSASRRMAAVGRLLAGVAHEVKNPLNAMTIHLELLRGKIADRPDAGRHADVISGEIRRLDEVVQEFLRFMRPEDLRLERVEVRGLVDEVIDVMGPEAAAVRIDVINDCGGSWPAVRADRAMLRQALLNLALNACQAMPDGGTLRFAGRLLRADVLEVTVADTGTGIAPEHLGKIFNLYFTTREGGTGLGLSMVYRTVQLHEGDIEVESTVGQGTVFRLRLPVSAEG
jgi:signal transduction histidine kinase